MARKFFLSSIATAFVFASQMVLADNIGVGKPGTNTTNSSMTTDVTTDDNIGVGGESWYELMIGWFGG